jgi:AraC family transcriptional activator of pobA
MGNMDDIYKIETVSEYNDRSGQQTMHPLVSIIDFSKSPLAKTQRIQFGVYAVYIKKDKMGDLRYGGTYYDYQEGTMMFIAPGQIITIENKEEYYQPSGHALVFHPDLLRGTALGSHIKEYTFFSYEAHEALHLSEGEKEVIFDCLLKIEKELNHAIDKHSKSLIVNNIELLLNYCIRFYDRQFITREHINKGILEKFEHLLDEYFISDNPQTIGLPAVGYFADQLYLSANYFGDLIKKETGTSAQEFIQSKLIEVAKQKIFARDKTMSQIAYELGFKYPQHFTRLFKQRVGHTPLEYVMLS